MHGTSHTAGSGKTAVSLSCDQPLRGEWCAATRVSAKAPKVASFAEGAAGNPAGRVRNETAPEII